MIDPDIVDANTNTSNNTGDVKDRRTELFTNL